MSAVDWIVLLGTLGFIVGWGVWKTRATSTSAGYLKGGADDRWWAVCLSVMATQASAITFLSTPGQGYADGLGFVQFYFGLPLAMVVIALVFIPLYYRHNVFTAYEFIGRRFDTRTRLLTAILFLIQRGMAAGITIYAPAIILCKVLDWPLSWTCVFIGVLTILYTTTGGARAVGVTHKQQMAVMIGGIVLAFVLIAHANAEHMGFGESLALANVTQKLDWIDTSFDPRDKYTLWSGLIGGFFLQLSYFGTDQSQVQRYLSGSSARQAKLGLAANGLLKIPMQFFILATGVLVWNFYVFHAPPLHWNEANLAAAHAADTDGTTRDLEAAHALAARAREEAANDFLAARRAGDDVAYALAASRIRGSEDERVEIEQRFRDHLKHIAPERESNDRDYVFISFVMTHLPIGVIGLLLAMIFCAGMSSTSAELSALATTWVVDVHRKERDDGAQVRATRLATIAFGALALGFAALFLLFENLIQAVNILGSLFYGTILGIFLVAFFVLHVRAGPVFVAALVSQAAILVIHAADLDIAFLWYNLIAPAIVVVTAVVLQACMPRKAP